MQFFRGSTANEVILFRVDAGEDVLEALQGAVAELGIESGAILTAVGVLERIHLEVPANLLWPPAVYAVEKQGPGQIIAGQGHLVRGQVELFLTVGRRNEVHAGKAMPGTLALHTVEVSLLRTAGPRWTRAPHPEFGYPVFQFAKAEAAPGVTLLGRPVDPAAISLVPSALLQRHGCLPVARSGDTLVVAMTDPNNPFAIDDLRQATGMRIQTVAVDARELVPALRQVLQNLPQG
jgi:predicted DNA-binding protein with PD1-like motif